mgnify:CR=1 FL=1
MKSKNRIPEAEDSLTRARYTLIWVSHIVDDDDVADELSLMIGEIYNVEERLGEVFVAGETR